MKYIWLVLGLLCSASFADARGGSVTRFDPNLYSDGGEWVCFVGAPVVGTCATALGAVCNGTTNANNGSNYRQEDDDAIVAWIDYGTARGASQSKLYIPPGSICRLSQARSLTFYGDHGATTYVQNAVIWAYGAATVAGDAANATQVNKIGGNGAQQGDTHTSFIQSVSAGATSVVLVTAGDASRISVGDYVVVDGLDTQTFGWPPNTFYFDYGIVTAKVGSTITLASPLKNTYLSTWPFSGTVEFGGPAAIRVLEPNWNTNITLYGLKMEGGGQSGLVGKNSILIDVAVRHAEQGFAAAFAGAIFMSGGFAGSGSEIDKFIGRWIFNRVNHDESGGYVFQSGAAPLSSVVEFWNSVVYGQVGTPGNLSFFNSRLLLSPRLGPVCCGASTTLYLDGTYVNPSPGTTLLNHWMDPADFTFSSGTFSTDLSGPGYPPMAGLGVPGYKLFYSRNGCNDPSSPLTYFTVTAMRQVSTTVFMDTDLAATPGAICNGQTCNFICGFGPTSIKQINSPAGSLDLTQFQAP